MLLPLIAVFLVATLFMGIYILRLQSSEKAHAEALAQERETGAMVRADLMSVQKNLESMRSNLTKRDQLVEKLEKQNTQLCHQLSELQTKSIGHKSQFETKEAALLNEKDHWQTQAQVLSTQLTELDSEKKALRKEFEAFKDESRGLRAPLEAEIKELKNRLSSQERELKRAQNVKAEKVVEARPIGGPLDPSKVEVERALLHRMRKKLIEYDFFLKAAKQRNSMLEEQNINWTTALNLLSTHILEEKVVNPLPTTLGEKVGLSLELCQQPSLVEDEFSYRQGVLPPSTAIATPLT